MKKQIIFIIFLAVSFITTNNIRAQEEMQFGAKAGLNFASVSGSNYGGNSFGNRTAFHIGGFVEIPMFEDFTIQPELLFSSEGAGLSVGLVSVGSDLKLNYVRVPVMAKYYFLEGLSAELGPVLGVLVSANDNYKDVLNTFDAQLGIGASYKFDFGLSAGLRYNIGITNIYDSSEFSGSAPSSKSNVFQITAGYTF